MRKRFSPKLSQAVLLCQLAVCLLSPGAVRGYEPMSGDEDLSLLSLEELMQVTVEKVVTASRFVQRVTEAPASMTVITRDDIGKFGYRTLADALRSVPGLYVTNDRNYSYLGVRGFSRPGDYNSRILLMVDGHRLNDNVFDTAAIGTEFPLDIDLIDRIEFMRGPGSSLYGSNAFFGVINIITRQASDVGTELASSAASYDTWSGRVSYGTSFTPQAGLLLSGSYYDSNGHGSLYFPEFATSPSGGYTRHTDYDTARQAFARLTLADFTLTGLYGSREKGIPTGAYSTLFNDPRTKTTDDRGYVDLSYRKNYSEALDVAARAFYDHYSFDGTYLIDSGSPPYIANLDTALGSWWGAEAVVSLAPLPKHHLSVGAEFRQNLAQDQKNFDDTDPASVNLDDRRRSLTWGIFAQDEYRLLKSLRATLGFRYDSYDRFNSFNPRATLVYTPVETTVLKLLYGEAFRAPNAYELFYQDGVSMVPNPGLKPEKIRTLEAVWEQYFLEHFRSSAGVFYYRVHDLISQTTTGDGGLIYRNIEKGEAVGSELALEGYWNSGLKGRLSYTWQQATDVNTGTLLTNSPRQLAKANLSVPLFRQQLFLSPELQYTGPRKTLGGNRTNAPLIANLTFSSTDLGLKGLEATASVYNMFDVRAEDVAGEEHRVQSSYPPVDSIRQDGINFRFKLIYRF